MKNLKVSVRLGIAFAAVLLLLVVISVVSLMQVRGLAHDMNNLTDVDFPKTVWANNVIDHVTAVGMNTRNALLADDASTVEQHLGRIPARSAQITENI